jgi:hypothetical protein
MPKKKRSVRQTPKVSPQLPVESYMPGKPQHFAEPHELAPELSQPLPAPPSESIVVPETQQEPTESVSDAQRKVPRPGSYYARPWEPYAMPPVSYLRSPVSYSRSPVSYSRSPVYVNPHNYRTMPYTYAPGRLVLVPVFPWYGY